LKYNQGIERLETLAIHAEKTENVSVVVDAENWNTVMGVDYIVLNAQIKFNKTRGVVYNTYQAYLRDSLSRIRYNVKVSSDMGFKTGIKLVRGAYMSQERHLASIGNYPDPINPSAQVTHGVYDNAIDFLFDHLNNVELLLGTHNEASCKKAADSLLQRGHTPENCPVMFAQLFGMCDHITLTLGKQGFRAFKYIPFGPVELTLPYLLRRAEENSDVLAGSQKQARMALEELKCRMGMVFPIGGLSKATV